MLGRNNWSNKSISIAALTLIEMIITITIMGVMFGLAMVNFSTLNSPKELVDEASNVIIQTCNQFIAESLNVDNEQVLCSIVAGTGSNRAGCGSSSVWNNINNNKFNSKITVTVQGSSASGGIAQIIYQNGLISKIKYTTSPTQDVFINNDNEMNIINPITFKVEFNTSNCFNNVKLWPSNVMAIEKNC